MFLQRKTLLVAAIVTGISGCGGGDSSSGNAPDPTPPPPVSETLYYAQDVIRHSAPSELFYVDLSKGMESSDGSSVSLTNVISLTSDDSCNVISQDRTGFTIDARSTKVCDYRFRVGAGSMPQSSASQGGGYAEATVRTAVGTTTESLLPLSAITSSSTSVTLDIVNLLGINSYILDTDQYTLSASIVLPNENKTKSTAIADVANNTIEYTPGTGIPSGVERILYSYSDGESVLTGTIDVAVSTDANSAPVAQSTFLREYKHPITGEAVSKIPNRMTTTIDVADLISDPDGDTLQLVGVYSYDVTLTIPEDGNGDGNKFNDTVFEFSSSRAGITNVAYVVSDGRAGYATGVLQLVVSDVYSSIYINDISPELLFIPPLEASVAEQAQLKHTAVAGDGSTSLLDIETASHDWSSANGYCEATGGSLPTIDELGRLSSFVKNKGGLFNGYDWPENRPYWSKTDGINAGGNKQALDFSSDSLLDDEAPEQANYVACISNSPLFVTVVGTPMIMPPDVTPDAPDSSAPELNYHYQLEGKTSKGTETFDDGLVSWFVNGVLPHYATFDSSTGILTVDQGKILASDTETTFSILGCYDSICDDMRVRIAFNWNVIQSNDIYEFSPLLAEQEARSLGVSLGVEDIQNDTYKNKDASLLKKEWVELPLDHGQAYCQQLAASGYEGGGWKTIDSNTIATVYLGLIAERMNATGIDGMTAGDMTSAFNLFVSDNLNTNLYLNWGAARKYYQTEFSGTVPNITPSQAVVVVEGGNSWINYPPHMAFGVCYREVP